MSPQSETSAPAEQVGQGSATASVSHIQEVLGTRLNVLSWSAERPRGRLLVVHGLGEHAGRYQSLAEGLTARGYSVVAFDLRGHGRSGGRRGHADSFDHLVDELDHVYRHVDGLEPDLPLALYAHSMGALIAIRWLQTKDAAALNVVLSAPWLGTLAKVPAWKRLVAKVLRFTAPWLAVPTSLDPSALTHDPEVQESYLSDPLLGRSVSVALWDAVARAQVAAVAGRVPRVPILLLLPGDDTVADADLAARWSKREGANVRILELPSFSHEPHSELGRREVFTRVADWLDESQKERYRRGGAPSVPAEPAGPERVCRSRVAQHGGSHAVDPNAPTLDRSKAEGP